MVDSYSGWVGKEYLKVNNSYSYLVLLSYIHKETGDETDSKYLEERGIIGEQS